jgi:cytochrome b6-f complex iron-sulfur subunit
MSSAVIIAIAVAALVVLAAVVLLTAARKSDVRGAGALSRETLRRDKDAEIDGPAPTGKDVERAAVQAREASLVVAAPTAPVEW